MHFGGNTAKFALTLLIGSIAQLVAWYAVAVRGLPYWAQGLTAVALVAATLLVRAAFDVLPLQQRIWAQERQIDLIDNQVSQSQQALSEIQRIMVNFLEHSSIYQDKVLDHLKLREDFVCVVKYGEGLSEVWRRLQIKERLPFTTVLASIPGSIQPFDNIDLFLIPTRSLPGIGNTPLRQYIDANIVPLVRAERRKFMRRHADLAQYAEDFSFRWMAFFLRKDAIAHGTLNRRFGYDFRAFVVGQQTGDSFHNMRSALGKVVKTKEILRLVSWASFADLSPERKGLLDRNSVRINSALEEQNIRDLPGLMTLTPGQLAHVIWSSLPRAEKMKSSKKKTLNTAKKVLEGVDQTVRVLRANGLLL
jgi:hypothetical protein